MAFDVIRQLAISVLLLAPAIPTHPATNPVQIRGEHIRDRFVTAIKACGVTPAFVPGILVKTEPTMVSYMFADRSVHLSRWDEIPAPVQAFLTAWAKHGTMSLDAEHMFGEIFNDFLVAHELGHYLEHMSGRMQTLDRTDSETEANEIALAFWSLDTRDAERLPKRFENVTRFLYTLPDPVPPGERPRTYLDKNIRKIAENGAAYSWYQGTFLRTAWANRGKRDFCGWVKLNPPLPAAKIER